MTTPGTEGEHPDTSGEKLRSRKRPAKPSAEDIHSILGAGQFRGEFGPKETRAEMDSRLKLKEADAAHERSQERIILIATIIGLGLVVVTCLGVALLSPSTESQKWAMSILSSIVSFGIGYLVRGRAGASA